jgi:aryl-alcohol dehydrogenase-like predicted oxidoreductase
MAHKTAFTCKRRSFLTLTAGALSGGCLSKKSGGKRFSAFDNVTLGKSKITTTRLSFGTGVAAWQRQSKQTKLGHEVFVNLLRKAYERGIRCFDAADLYGSHTILAEALAPFPRDSYVLISKIWWRKGGIPDKDKQAVPLLLDRFLKETKTDYLDLVQLHCLEEASWPTELETMMADLDAAKKKGKIRAHGVSVHGFKALEQCTKESWVDVAHVRINPFGAKMDGAVEANTRVIETMHAAGQGIIGMKILGEGSFANESEKVNYSLSYALKSGFVDVLNIGFLNLDEIDDIVTRIAQV